MNRFELSPRLAADCIQLGRLELCRVLLMNDSQYPWLILVPERAGLREVYELAEADRELLWRESCWISERLMTHFRGDKLNLAALGNLVPQLHLHHVVRYRTDPAWPAPVWGQLPAKPYEPTALAARRAELADLLAERLRPL